MGMVNINLLDVDFKMCFYYYQLNAVVSKKFKKSESNGIIIQYQNKTALS